jgi:hypothetical protein
MKLNFSLILVLCLLVLNVSAQESLGPLRYRPELDQAVERPRTAAKTSVITLPFFEDFTDYSLYPNPARWADSNVYINNTMGVSVISRGVATFDALNNRGRPYDTAHRFTVLYADSLTSQPIDLSTHTAADSIYLSFFFQPQGNGFSPETGDSLMLFLRRRSGGWLQAWAAPGTDLAPFRQVMIAVTDTSLFFDNFQFRFVNKASINTNDDHWHIDYVRMAATRNYLDTAVRDLAFTTDPTNLLNDYTSMPYRQFLANAAAERAATQRDSMRNHYGTNATTNFGFTAVETTTGAPLGSGSSTANISAYGRRENAFPVYSTTMSAPSSRSRIVYRNSYFLQSGNPTEPKDNDSIVQEQIFDNYLAYDDGTAEKSYFLNISESLPGRIAVEFRLNTPDTLRGMAIYFGQQVPSGYSKYFSIAVYTALAGVSGANADIKIHEETDFLPLYTGVQDRFTIYKFETPVTMPAGVFYLGTTQPASSGSDSLYIGFDVNRTGGNHLYLNVGTGWQGSLFSGALMIRPLLGGPVTGTSVSEQKEMPADWSFSPNPAADQIRVQGNFVMRSYSITDIRGRIVQEGALGPDQRIPVPGLLPGMYFLRIMRPDGRWSVPSKLIKQ